MIYSAHALIIFQLARVSIGGVLPKDASPSVYDATTSSSTLKHRQEDNPGDILQDITGVIVNIGGDPNLNEDIIDDPESSVEQFKAALEAEDLDYDGDFYEAATALQYPAGHHGCEDWQKKDIYRGWGQSWKIMNRLLEEIDSEEGINWNEASAVEYLGAPDLYKRWATIQPGYIPTWLDWKLHARCDDPRGKCGDPCDSDLSKRGPYAYTTNKDADSGLARINFCPRYFATPNLDDAVKNGNTPSLGPSWQYDVGSYLMNKGHIWGHELMHVNWATNAEEYSPEGLEKHRVSDIRFSARSVSGEERTFKAYGPQAVKALARYPVDTGEWVIRNADSLSLYALVRYLQNKLENTYPHLPLAPAAPDGVWDPNNRESDAESLPYEKSDQQAWDMFGNGTVGLPPVHNYYSHAQLDASECSAAYSADDYGDAIAYDDVWDEDDMEAEPELVVDRFASKDDLEEDYVDQLNAWWEEFYDQGDCEIPSGCFNAAAPDGCAIACYG